MKRNRETAGNPEFTLMEKDEWMNESRDEYASRRNFFSDEESATSVPLSHFWNGNSNPPITFFKFLLRTNCRLSQRYLFFTNDDVQSPCVCLSQSWNARQLIPLYKQLNACYNGPSSFVKEEQYFSIPKRRVWRMMKRIRKSQQLQDADEEEVQSFETLALVSKGHLMIVILCAFHVAQQSWRIFIAGATGSISYSTDTWSHHGQS